MLRADMNKYARALLHAAYRGIVADENGQYPGIEETPKPDIFNAVVNWMRTDAGMESINVAKSGVATLTERMKSK